MKKYTSLLTILCISTFLSAAGTTRTEVATTSSEQLTGGKFDLHGTDLDYEYTIYRMSELSFQFTCKNSKSLTNLIACIQKCKCNEEERKLLWALFIQRFMEILVTIHHYQHGVHVNTTYRVEKPDEIFKGNWGSWTRALTVIGLLSILIGSGAAKEQGPLVGLAAGTAAACGMTLFTYLSSLLFKSDYLEISLKAMKKLQSSKILPQQLQGRLEDVLEKIENVSLNGKGNERYKRERLIYNYYREMKTKIATLDEPC